MKMDTALRAQVESSAIFCMTFGCGGGPNLIGLWIIGPCWVSLEIWKWAWGQSKSSFDFIFGLTKLPLAIQPLSFASFCVVFLSSIIFSPS
jgi:hypothetical protein